MVSNLYLTSGTLGTLKKESGACLLFQLIDGAIILFGCLQLQEEQIGKMNFIDILICNDPNDTLLSDSPLYVTGIITLVVCCVFPVLLIGVVLVSKNTYM